MKTVFTGRKAMIFLGEMLKCTDEALETSRDGKRGNKKIKVSMKEGKLKREKLVLKFTRCATLDCAKEGDLMKRRGEWKVSTLSKVQTNTVEENKSEAVNSPGSTDDEKLVKIVDVSDPWSEIKEGKIRKLKMKEMNELCKPCVSKTETEATYLKSSTTELANISALKKEEVLSNFLFVVGSKAPYLKKSTESFTNYKAGLKRIRRDRRLKQNKTSTCVHKKVTLQPLFVVGQKTSLKNAKNKFRIYREYKAGLKRYSSNRDFKQNQISKNFQVKRVRKRL